MPRGGLPEVQPIDRSCKIRETHESVPAVPGRGGLLRVARFGKSGNLRQQVALGVEAGGWHRLTMNRVHWMCSWWVPAPWARRALTLSLGSGFLATSTWWTWTKSKSKISIGHLSSRPNTTGRQKPPLSPTTSWLVASQPLLIRSHGTHLCRPIRPCCANTTLGWRWLTSTVSVAPSVKLSARNAPGLDGPQLGNPVRPSHPVRRRLPARPLSRGARRPAHLRRRFCEAGVRQTNRRGAAVLVLHGRALRHGSHREDGRRQTPSRPQHGPPFFRACVQPHDHESSRGRDVRLPKNDPARLGKEMEPCLRASLRGAEQQRQVSWSGQEKAPRKRGWLNFAVRRWPRRAGPPCLPGQSPELSWRLSGLCLPPRSPAWDQLSGL